MAANIIRRWRSTTEYCFDKDQTDAIVRTTAYRRKESCQSLIWFSPREHVAVRPSIATPFLRTPDTGLGALGRLPLELLQKVLLHLDLRSLLIFRQANLGSRQVVDSLYQYQRVVSHGLNLLCALFRTRLAIDISLLDFYDALCTKACTFCGQFGGFVFLPTWSRCCFICIQNASGTQMLTPAGIREEFPLTEAEVAQLRPFKTLPGIYGMGPPDSPIALVSVAQAKLIVSGQPPHATAAQARSANFRRITQFSYMGSCALPYYDRRTGRAEYGMSCAGCLLGFQKSIIIGSESEQRGFMVRDKVYAQDSFLAHFRWCANRAPEAARRRGFFNNRE
ncbi:hypothetical protein F5144DRAFT_655950 [Chaetomium tenue]|uniref:Uncharacterized protein n=1 Tax=Chaetomium tenue TaxID=1854479 RepID=A0ACB7NYE1_9PEZI|nr:hypothetical protein F5144DRAFT_655950 [Chaetomium globosum]